ncbi:MAG: trypsin-like peptidase domain-containing protein [Pseudomonadota bacterium]|nr:trypsin-like peptidase domain-containing protein [Pseudomonadota bacterium]
MKPRLLSVLVLMAGMMFFRLAPADAQLIQMQDNSSALIHRLLPTVVNVTGIVASGTPPEGAMIASGDPGVEATQQKKKLGSGFIVDADGVIVTNYHVVDGAYKIIITFSDGLQLAAQVSEADRLSDIALLKVEAGRPLAVAHWGDSATLQVGDPVIAVGNPLGVGMTVTGGIVSAFNRDIMETPYDDFIQTDAPLNHGNSGGPLFDMKGAVVGINSAIISPTAGSAGLGFAIPSRDARFVIKRLQQYGWIRPGYLGAKIQELSPEMAEALGIKTPKGSIVAHVVSASPAAKAGVAVGDIILRLNGEAPTDDRALLRQLAQMTPGDKATLTVQRGDKDIDLTATIGEWPRQRWEDLDRPVDFVDNALYIPPDLGIKVAPVSKDQLTKYGLSDTSSGAVVSAVAAGTDAAARGISTGDVILRVQDQAVKSEVEILQTLEQARKQGRTFAMFLVLPKAQVHPGPEWIPLQISQ